MENETKKFCTKTENVWNNLRKVQDIYEIEFAILNRYFGALTKTFFALSRSCISHRTYLNHFSNRSYGNIIRNFDWINSRNEQIYSFRASNSISSRRWACVHLTFHMQVKSKIEWWLIFRIANCCSCHTL